MSLLSESPLRLTEAANLIPAVRGASRCHVSTLLRWILRGVKSSSGDLVRLEGVKIGGCWLTSREAIDRFVERLTPDPNSVQQADPPRSATARQRASERVDRRLRAAGI
jgi:hypothetical protein